jgi:hypothetical protein
MLDLVQQEVKKAGFELWSCEVSMYPDFFHFRHPISKTIKYTTEINTAKLCEEK